jgi:hypothetical protein
MCRKLYILHRNLDYKDNIQGLQSRRPKYESYHVITCVEVKHGRNHLITGHRCIPLTSAREIIIDANDSQGAIVQSIDCE